MTYSPQFFMELKVWLREKDVENAAAPFPLILCTENWLDLAQEDFERAIPEHEPVMTEKEAQRVEAESHVHP